MRALHSYILLEALTVLMAFFFALLHFGADFFYFLHLRIEVRGIGCTDDILSGHILEIILNVVAYGIVEEDRLLADHSQRASQVVDIIIFYVYPIDQDLSFLCIVKSLQ
jgi:hypothetical protein